MAWTDLALLLYAALLAAVAAYGFARSKYQALVTEEIRQRGPLLDKARVEAEVKAGESRRQVEEQLEEARRQAEEARRFSDKARSALDAARREAAMEVQASVMEAVEKSKVDARREAESVLEERKAELARREALATTKASAAEADKREAEKLVEARRKELEALAGISGDEAKKKLSAELLDGVRRDSAREAKAIEDAAKDEANKRAARIVGIAIQRFAGEHVQERAVTTVHLPSDDMKGRLIGREGRNIKSLTETCGVDFIIDDTPEVVVISSFDPVRREVARLTVEELVKDGRIQPSRIEEVVAKMREEVERGVSEHGEQALLELGLAPAHPEISKLLGGLRYRYSHAQNVLKHSIECGFLAGLMAAELGLPVDKAKRAGLLHDIGKAVSHEQEGGHAVIGGNYARKYGEDPIVANAIAAHHEDEPPESVIAHLVAAADALSGARPGARREALEGYVKRLQDLERIASQFAGVERVFALQAGREVRVMVEPGEVSDAEAALLAREISKRVEEEMTYPGQIRVTVVRETRAVDYAK